MCRAGKIHRREVLQMEKRKWSDMANLEDFRRSRSILDTTMVHVRGIRGDLQQAMTEIMWA